MHRFARLYQRLDASTATSEKLAALQAYFAEAPAADAAWAVYFLAGGKPRQVVPVAVLRATACRLAGVADWLFEECYQAVGDLAETIALVLPRSLPAALPDGLSDDTPGLAHWVEQRLLPLRGLSPAEQEARLAAAFAALDGPGRFLCIKLIGGGFRVGVSKLLVQRALAESAGLDPKRVAQRMMGYAEARATPSAERFAALVAPLETVLPQAGGQPYPFFLAHALPVEHTQPAALAQALGDARDWLLEWKYDGIRAQVVRRDGACWIWSRGEELVTEAFPEVAQATRAQPDGLVLDGELLVWHAGEVAPASFHRLQQRLGRKTLSKKLLADAPVVFVAYDLLEWDGVDARARPQAERRARLEQIEALGSAAGQGPLRQSARLAAADWREAAAWRAASREHGVEGLMLKQATARYGSGRTRSEGTWWKWKIDPLVVDAVLVYAQAGHGRRAGVYTDYTFAVWSRPPRDAAEAQAVVEAIARREPPPPRDSAALQLLPFAKAYSGLTDEEFAAVDREIRAHTLTRFGPVRSVRPTLVFELGFEGIAASGRHKSGIAVRFPRMLRLRPDKPLHEADSIETLQALIQG